MTICISSSGCALLQKISAIYCPKTLAPSMRFRTFTNHPDKCEFLLWLFCVLPDVGSHHRKYTQYVRGGGGAQSPCGCQMQMHWINCKRKTTMSLSFSVDICFDIAFTGSNHDRNNIQPKCITGDSRNLCHFNQPGARCLSICVDFLKCSLSWCVWVCVSHFAKTGFMQTQGEKIRIER